MGVELRTLSVVSMETSSEGELTRAVLSSSIFRVAMAQKHHLDTTVGVHSLEVRRDALRLARFLGRFGIHTDEKVVSVAALCHDLGIVDRYTLYRNNFQCYQRHPDASVTETRKLIADMDDKTANAIRCHMWPLTPLRIPRSKEGWIVSAADKYASVASTLRHSLEKPRSRVLRARQRRGKM